MTLESKDIGFRKAEYLWQRLNSFRVCFFELETDLAPVSL